MRFVLTCLEAVCRVFSVIAIAILAVLALPMIYDVVLRTAGHPTIWAFEVTTYALVAGMFLANAHALRGDRHFRVTFLAKTFPALSPALDAFAALATIALAVLLIVSGIGYVREAYVTGMRSATLLSVPMAIPRLALPLGGVALLAQAVINLVRPLSARRDRPLA